MTGADRERLAELTEIYADAVGHDDVRRDDDFFALGGTSSGAVRIVLAVEERFGVRIEIEDFLDQPTLHGLATAVEQAEGAAR